MHLLVLIQQRFPKQQVGEVVEEFIREISSKEYNARRIHSSWNRIRPREIHIFDFTIPESIEKEVIADLKNFEGRIQGYDKFFNNDFLMGMARKCFNIKDIDRTIEPSGMKFEKKGGVYLYIVGKIEDEKIGNLEML